MKTTATTKLQVPTRIPLQQLSSVPHNQHEQHQPPSSGDSLTKGRSLELLSPSAAAERSHSKQRPWRNVNRNNKNIKRTGHCNTISTKSNPTTRRTNKTRQRSSSSRQQRLQYWALNRELVAAQSVSEILSLLQKSAKLEQVAAGKSLNRLNFSTALHRLARHATTPLHINNVDSKVRQNSPASQSLSQVQSDPTTALLLASIAECMVDSTMEFREQDLANMAWALAKLQLAPPLSTLQLTAEDCDNNNHSSPCHELLAATAASVRRVVTKVAQELTTGTNLSSTDAHHWMSVLMQLAGHILDVIGETFLQRAAAPATSPSTQSFQMQHWSNMLWTWATAGRANGHAFAVVIRYMIQQHAEILRQQEHRNRLSCNASPATEDPSIVPTKEQDLLQPQVWANAVWAFATAKCYDSHDELLVYFAHLLDEYPDFISMFNSQDISNTAWGIATLLSNRKQVLLSRNDGLPSTPIQHTTELGHQAALTILRSGFQLLVQRRAYGFRTQELSNSIWAAATLGFGLTTQNTLPEHRQRSNNYVLLKSRQPTADAQLMVEVVNALVEASLPQLVKFSSQQLSNWAWALARLVSNDSNQNFKNSTTKSMWANVRALVEGIGWQLADPRRVVTSQDVGMTLWALARLEFDDKDMYRGIARHLSSDQAHTYEPPTLSRAVWAFATAEAEVEDFNAFDSCSAYGLEYPGMTMDPITMCFAIAAKELIRRPYQFEPQAVTNILWAFSKVGIRHPDLFKFAAEHLVGCDDGSVVARGLDEFIPQGLANIAWAYAIQAQLAQATLDRLNFNGRLIVYESTDSHKGEQLLQRLFCSITTRFIHVHDDLRKANPQAVSNIAWSIAVLGLKDTTSMFVEAANGALVDR